ncbi:MAG: MBL fold metallo-hydrolase [Paludibacteraceae bacterium]|nr:MBL fold metallo-hydrolase [Paludibacteraceae bacterium]
MQKLTAMQVVSLIDDIGSQPLSVEHGLSLYIRTEGGTMLFDMGQTAAFAANARQLKCPLEKVDWAVVSHGHYDHGGGLRTFLECNGTAPVYVQKHAFEKHLSLRESGLRDIGLDVSLREHPQITFCEGETPLTEHILLFDDVCATELYPPANRRMFGASVEENDAFLHEQNMIIEEAGMYCLFAGCAHHGIVNVVNKAAAIIGHAPEYVFGGMHLAKSGWTDEEENDYLDRLAARLIASGSRYITMHCTGKEAYLRLKQRMGDLLAYLPCGEEFDTNIN